MLIATLFGCGASVNNDDSDNRGDAFAAFVAKKFDADCRRAKAPTPKLARDLDQLCTCANRKILSEVRYGDSDDVVNAKIDKIGNECTRLVYPDG